MRNKHYFMVPNDQESELIRIFCLILRTISNKVGGLEEVWSLRFVYTMMKNLSNLIFSTRNNSKCPDEEPK